MITKTSKTFKLFWIANDESKVDHHYRQIGIIIDHLTTLSM